MKFLNLILFNLIAVVIFGQSFQVSPDTFFLNSPDRGTTFGDITIINPTDTAFETNIEIKPICIDDADDTSISISFILHHFAPINSATNFGDLIAQSLGTLEPQSIDSAFLFEVAYANHLGSIWEVTFSEFNNPSNHTTLIVMIDNCPAISQTNALFELSDFEVFPNPFSTQVNFNFKEADQNRKIKLVNLFGKEISTFEAKSKSVSIDLKAFPPGTYVAKIQSPEQKYQSKRILKF